MSVTRIGEFRAKPERIEAMREFLQSIVPDIKSSAGCEACQLFQSEDDPTRFVMIEVWDSADAHQAAASDIPPELLAQIRPLLADVPSGGYFRTLASI